MTILPTFHRVAILNRGDAAMRFLRAAKTLRASEGSGLTAIAFYTEADRDAPYVRHADDAHPLDAPRGEVAAWLDHAALLGALGRAGADAVWPGWGFVAEDAAFVERVTDAGISFLGPSAATMRALGDKIAAKLLAERTGVPVAPWSGTAVSSESATASAEHVGFPLLVKASAGGGGRGIRVVEDAAALASAVGAAAAEATAAFGDGRVFLERLVRCGRHIEVQIAGDACGRIVAFGCRECSVQRRHQKLIEEAPPPGVAAETLAALEAAAVRIAAAVGYVGVGTVEFLLAGDRFFFLEVNPRLQVEHGITEAITGVDLVQLQIRIARGEPLPPDAPPLRGTAIEVRICAEEPDADFAPAPGAIARFDPALGPNVRIDTGVVAGSRIPAAFDSLVAKVIATGETREDARATLVCALADFDLVIAGGASNKGHLIELLETPELRAGGVDTEWLDRRRRTGRVAPFAVEALVAAAILSYQRERSAARLNFYADPANPAVSRVPRSHGLQIDLTHRGVGYRAHVRALGAWRYRVRVDDREIDAMLREEDEHAARLVLGGRTFRILVDVSDAGLRVEVEGHAHRFGAHGIGHVRAPAPAMVVAVGVETGDRVAAGNTVAVLEAMKTEIAVVAPVVGVVAEVRVRPGQQVAAGDVLLVIVPATVRSEVGGERLTVPSSPLPVVGQDGGSAIETLRAELRQVLLGYDADPERTSTLVELLTAPLPGPGAVTGGEDPVALGSEILLFADVESLFDRTPQTDGAGNSGPSSSAWLRTWIRRMRAGGAGIPESFLAMLRAALRHYGVTDLTPSDALERAVLRLLATQHDRRARHDLVRALLGCVGALARSGVSFDSDVDLADALTRIAALRGLVPDALADAALESHAALFEGPALEAEATGATAELEPWLAAVEREPVVTPPAAVLMRLARAPRSVFDRVGSWLTHPDPRRVALALSAHLRRVYAYDGSLLPIDAGGAPVRVLGFRLSDGRQVLAVSAPADDGVAAATALAHAAADATGPLVLDLFIPAMSASDDGTILAALDPARADRVTLSHVERGGPDRSHTYEGGAAGWTRETGLHDVHPEVAARLDLARLAHFALERLPAPDGLYCFHGISPTQPGDERLFVLADVPGAGPDPEPRAHVAVFERAFHAATQTLRTARGLRDPARRLHWNRIVMVLGAELFLDPGLAEGLAARLAPETRHLGLEKVVVRLRVRNRAAPDSPGQAVEAVISDLTGSRTEIELRSPRTAPLEPASPYEQHVVEARRRRLLYPYELVRLLAPGSNGSGRRAAAAFSSGRFEEWDLDPTEIGQPRAVPVPGRPYGRNESAVVFGIITTPTEKHPEGMARVLLVSDPTRGMGALGVAECDRVVAAIDLAERQALPIEWVPISSGARIAMDSGTENLDATARVVRRIVSFTRRGGVIHVLVSGVNVGAQSYWNALATMLMHTRGALVMTPGASMVLTGRAALEASGSVSAEDEVAIGGYERVMGPNGEAQYDAPDIVGAYRLLYAHYAYTYVAPGERRPRARATTDAFERDVTASAYAGDPDDGFQTVGEIFDERSNAGRKRPFAMRAVMQAVVDQDGGWLERWRRWAGAETAIVWDTHLGGLPVCLIGIESRPIVREGHRASDGPAEWSGGTLFPLSSKKVARALGAASGNRPVVVLANLSGFDGSPESMRRLQLEHGAEIARAVVEFDGPLCFLVVSRYHGGAYVVFSTALNPALHASAIEGSHASVIGGAPAAAVVFTREVRARAAADPAVRRLRQALGPHPGAEARASLQQAMEAAMLDAQRRLAQEFDAIHSVERARRVGSLDAVVPASRMRPHLIGLLHRALGLDPAATDRPRSTRSHHAVRPTR